MVLLRTSTVIGYDRHFFTIIATPTVLWRPLRMGELMGVWIRLSRAGHYEPTEGRLQLHAQCEPANAGHSLGLLKDSAKN